MSTDVVSKYVPLPSRQVAQDMMKITCNGAKLGLLTFKSMVELENSTGTRCHIAPSPLIDAAGSGPGG